MGTSKPVNWAGNNRLRKVNIMATVKSNTTPVDVPVVEELCNWITTKMAAELMRVELPSVGAIIHSGRVKACRIAGVFLIDKDSAIEFGKQRAEIVAAELARKSRSERLEKLTQLSDEQLEKLLSQVETK